MGEGETTLAAAFIPLSYCPLTLDHYKLTPLVNKLEQQLITRDWLAVNIAASSEAITAIGTVMQFDGWV